MNFIEQMLIFYILVVFIIIYFFSGIRIPYGKILIHFRSFREKIKRRIRDKKVLTKLYNMIFPYKPKTLSEILLITILYLFFGYLVLSKIFFLAVVVSDSMRPTLEKGDLVLIQTISKKPEEGDVILFSGFIELDQERRETVIHRVYKVNKDGSVLTKGDAMPRVDPWVVPPEKIIGKAVVILGHPVVIKHVGEGLIIEPGKAITNPILIQYILGTTRKTGLLIFIIVMIMYMLLEVREMRVRRIPR